MKDCSLNVKNSLANISIFITCEIESESEDEEYKMVHDSQNEQPTGITESTPTTDQPCSTGSSASASAIACTTDVIAID